MLGSCFLCYKPPAAIHGCIHAAALEGSRVTPWRGRPREAEHAAPRRSRHPSQIHVVDVEERCATPGRAAALAGSAPPPRKEFVSCRERAVIGEVALGGTGFGYDGEKSRSGRSHGQEATPRRGGGRPWRRLAGCPRRGGGTPCAAATDRTRVRDGGKGDAVQENGGDARVTRL